MKEKINLYPIDQNDQVLEQEFEVVEDLDSFVRDLLAKTNIVLVAEKNCLVSTRDAQLGELVDTRPRTNINNKIYCFSEAKRTVNDANQIIVKNPDGEEYLMSYEKFFQRYSKQDEGWVSKGEPQKFVVVHKNIVIQPKNWGGEKQYICNGGLLNITDKNDIYGITNHAFDNTYKITKKIDIKQREIEK